MRTKNSKSRTISKPWNRRVSKLLMIGRRQLPVHRLGGMNKMVSAMRTRRSKLRDGNSKRKSQEKDRRKWWKRRRISMNKKGRRNSRRRLLLRLKEPNGKKTKSWRMNRGGLRRKKRGKGTQRRLNGLELRKSKGSRKNKKGKMS
jgi:hypothetical protein